MVVMLPVVVVFSKYLLIKNLGSEVFPYELMSIDGRIIGMFREPQIETGFTEV